MLRTVGTKARAPSDEKGIPKKQLLSNEDCGGEVTFGFQPPTYLSSAKKTSGDDWANGCSALPPGPGQHRRWSTTGNLDESWVTTSRRRLFDSILHRVPSTPYTMVVYGARELWCGATPNRSSHKTVSPAATCRLDELANWRHDGVAVPGTRTYLSSASE